MKINNKKLALGGIIGGILYMLANLLLHMSAGMTGDNPDPGWASMAAILSGISELLAVLGSVGFLMGFLSLYHMVSDTCGSKMRRQSVVPAIGVVGMALFHGNVNCIEPLIYKVLVQNGITAEVYTSMDAAISSSFAPVDLLILVAFYIQLIVLIYGVFSGKFGVKKWLIIFNPIVGLVLGVVLGMVLPGAVNGLSYGMRSLGEGLMYLIPYTYWKSAKPIAQ